MARLGRVARAFLCLLTVARVEGVHSTGTLSFFHHGVQRFWTPSVSMAVKFFPQEKGRRVGDAACILVRVTESLCWGSQSGGAGRRGSSLVLVNCEFAECFFEFSSFVCVEGLRS